MARYTYNASLVSQTIEDLSLACKSLDNTNGDMQKGLNTILNARGAENIQGDFSFVTGYQSQVIEFIDAMSTEISSKAQEIEEYQSAPWYKKLFATLGLGALKIFEGLGSFVENIGDGLVSIGGFVGGIFSSEFQESCAEYVKKDHVGDAFAGWYEGDGALGWLNKYSYMSHESTAANVLKGIGTATGYIVVGVATGGAGLAGLGVSAGTAFVGGIGSGTQSGLQQGMSFNDAFGKGVKQGATSAATTLIVGGIANKLGSLAKGAGAADDVVNATDDVIGAADDVMGAADDVMNSSTGLATTTGKVTAVGDDIVSGIDDTLNVTGHVADPAGNVMTVAKNAAGETVLIGQKGGQLVMTTGQMADDAINAAVKSGGVMDDIVGSGSKALATVDDVANAGKNSLNIADDIIDVTDDAVNITDDVANAASKPPKTGIVDKVIAKGDKIVTNFGTNTKVGQTLANAAAKAGPKGIGGIAAAAGQGLGSTPINQAMEGTQFRIDAGAEPSMGQQLYEEALATKDQNLPTYGQDAITTPPGGDTAGIEQGGNTGGDYGQGDYGTPTNPSPNPGHDDYDLIKKPDPIPTPDPIEPPKPEPKPQPKPDPIPEPKPDPIPGPKPDPKPDIPTPPRSDDYKDLISGDDSSITSGDLMDSLGNATGSLSDIATSSTNIPTSASPILTSDGLKPKSSSVIPIAAGLGAAGLAGLGTKAYLDKKENEDEEEEDSIETEEWEEDADSMNIDYGEEDSEEADYLTPTDEYAFQES